MKAIRNAASEWVMDSFRLRSGVPEDQAINAHADLITIMENFFADDWFTVEQSPVGTAQVFEEILVSLFSNLGMVPRNGAAREADIAVRVSADGCDIALQFGCFGDVIARGIEKPDAGTSRHRPLDAFIEKPHDQGIVVVFYGCIGWIERAATMLTEAAFFVVIALAARTMAHLGSTPGAFYEALECLSTKCAGNKATAWV